MPRKKATPAPAAPTDIPKLLPPVEYSSAQERAAIALAMLVAGTFDELPYDERDSTRQRLLLEAVYVPKSYRDPEHYTVRDLTRDLAAALAGPTDHKNYAVWQARAQAAERLAATVVDKVFHLEEVALADIAPRSLAAIKEPPKATGKGKASNGDSRKAARKAPAAKKTPKPRATKPAARGSTVGPTPAPQASSAGKSNATGKAGSKDPRSACHVCGREVPVTRRGTFRQHITKAGGPVCVGSGMAATPLPVRGSTQQRKAAKAGKSPPSAPTDNPPATRVATDAEAAVMMKLLQRMDDGSEPFTNDRPEGWSADADACEVAFRTKGGWVVAASTYLHAGTARVDQVHSIKAPDGRSWGYDELPDEVLEWGPTNTDRFRDAPPSPGTAASKRKAGKGAKAKPTTLDLGLGLDVDPGEAVAG